MKRYFFLSLFFITVFGIASISVTQPSESIKKEISQSRWSRLKASVTKYKYAKFFVGILAGFGNSVLVFKNADILSVPDMCVVCFVVLPISFVAGTIATMTTLDTIFGSSSQDKILASSASEHFSSQSTEELKDDEQDEPTYSTRSAFPTQHTLPNIPRYPQAPLPTYTPPTTPDITPFNAHPVYYTLPSPTN